MEKSGLLVLFLFRRNIYCKRQLRNKEAKRLNLITKRVHMNRCNGREVKQLTLDRDFNVPDARPDALQIMKEQGEVQIEEVHMMEGKASVKGLLHFQILYASDGDIPVSEMTGTIPFEETIPLPQAKAEDEISVQAEIGDLKSELINSRKLGMKVEKIFIPKKERQKFPIWFLVKKIRCGYGMSGKFPERKTQCSGFCTRMFALGN